MRAWLPSVRRDSISVSRQQFFTILCGSRRDSKADLVPAAFTGTLLEFSECTSLIAVSCSTTASGHLYYQLKDFRDCSKCLECSNQLYAARLWMPAQRYTEGIRRREDLLHRRYSDPWSFCCSVLCRVETSLRSRALGAPQVERMLVYGLVQNYCREYRDQMSYVRVAFSALHDETVLSCHLGCRFGL